MQKYHISDLVKILDQISITGYYIAYDNGNAKIMALKYLNGTGVIALKSKNRSWLRYEVTK